MEVALRGAGPAHGDGEKEGLCGLEPVNEHRRQRGPSEFRSDDDSVICSAASLLRLLANSESLVVKRSNISDPSRFGPPQCKIQCAPMLDQHILLTLPVVMLHLKDRGCGLVFGPNAVMLTIESGQTSLI